MGGGGRRIPVRGPTETLGMIAQRVQKRTGSRKGGGGVEEGTSDGGFPTFTLEAQRRLPGCRRRATVAVIITLPAAETCKKGVEFS